MMGVVVKKQKPLSKLERAKEEWRNMCFGEARKLLVEATEQGGVEDTGEAYYWLGLCYQYGSLMLQPDYTKGTDCLTKAAHLGHPMAMYRRAGVVCMSESNEWFVKAFESGDDHVLARCYCYGNVVVMNNEKAKYHFERAAVQGNMEAQYELASYYENGGGGMEPNISRAFELSLVSAQQGYSPAQINTAMNYLYGVGTRINEFSAFKWYTRHNQQSPFVHYDMLESRFEHIVERENARRAIFSLVLIHKHRLSITIINTLPYDILKLVIAELWKTRHDPFWNFGIDEIIK